MPPFIFTNILSLIDIKNLIVDFEVADADGVALSKKRVLNDITLSIDDGEFVSILGKNGSGKSTLAKCLNALILPTSGDVEILGLNTKDEKNLMSIRQNVGMTFQNPDNQIVSSIVEEDIAFGLENLGIETEEMKARIDTAMRSIGILDLRNSMVSKLSGGQKQKVSIAGILAMKPKIIVLDEPTSMIDKSSRVDLLNTVKYLNEHENITVLLISHYVEEIMYGKRTIVLNDGRIIADDIPSEILLRKDILDFAGIDMPYIPKLATELKNLGKKLKGNETKVESLCQYLK